MVVVFFILDWIFVLMMAATMIPLRAHLIEAIVTCYSRELEFSFFFHWRKFSNSAIFVNTCFSPPPP